MPDGARLFDGHELFYVAKEQVSACFGDFVPLFLKILEREPHLSLRFIHDTLTEGRATVWVLRKAGVMTGLMVTQIEIYGDSRLGLLWMVAGEGIQSGYEVFREVLEPWFKANGCHWIEARGRKGWTKVLPDYEQVGVILRKQL